MGDGEVPGDLLLLFDALGVAGGVLHVEEVSGLMAVDLFGDSLSGGVVIKVDGAAANDAANEAILEVVGVGAGAGNEGVAIGVVAIADETVVGVVAQALGVDAGETRSALCAVADGIEVVLRQADTVLGFGDQTMQGIVIVIDDAQGVLDHLGAASAKVDGVGEAEAADCGIKLSQAVASIKAEGLGDGTVLLRGEVADIVVAVVGAASGAAGVDGVDRAEASRCVVDVADFVTGGAVGFGAEEATGGVEAVVDGAFVGGALGHLAVGVVAMAAAVEQCAAVPDLALVETSEAVVLVGDFAGGVAEGQRGMVGIGGFLDESAHFIVFELGFHPGEIAAADDLAKQIVAQALAHAEGQGTGDSAAGDVVAEESGVALGVDLFGHQAT